MCSVVCGQCRGIGCSNSAQPDESDCELHVHQDEDRPDPEKTEVEGDLSCYISCL